MAGRVADRAVQVFGGRGYMRENVAERFYRELRVERIWEGASEVQRVIIAEQLAKRGRCPAGLTISPQHLLHRLALGELVDELVEVADLLHQRVLDLLDADPAHRPGDQRGVRVERRVGEEVLERRLLVRGARPAPRSSKPVSHSMTSSTSALVRPFRSALVT